MSDARRELERAQAVLLAALQDGATLPAGFDRARVELAGRGLRSKRARAAARTWRGLHRWLGVEFFALFEKHVAPLPLSERHAALHDGLQLLRALAAERVLSPEVQRQQFEVRLRFVETSRGLEPRRGPVLALARVGRQVVIAAGWGAHLRALQLGWGPGLGMGARDRVEASRPASR